MSKSQNRFDEFSSAIWSSLIMLPWGSDESNRVPWGSDEPNRFPSVNPNLDLSVSRCRIPYNGQKVETRLLNWKVPRKRASGGNQCFVWPTGVKLRSFEPQRAGTQAYLVSSRVRCSRARLNTLSQEDKSCLDCVSNSNRFLFFSNLKFELEILIFKIWFSLVKLYFYS